MFKHKLNHSSKFKPDSRIKTLENRRNRSRARQYFKIWSKDSEQMDISKLDNFKTYMKPSSISSLSKDMPPLIIAI